VPELRIVAPELWDRVKARQADMDERRAPKDKGDHKHLSSGHATRRPVYLLSGLACCGVCGGLLTIAGSGIKRYYCANAREKGPLGCTGMKGIRQDQLEQLVLSGIREGLMQPAAVEAFGKAYLRHVKKLMAEAHERQAHLRKRLADIGKELANIMTAIKAGIITRTTKDELTQLETEQAELEARLAAAPAAPVAIDARVAEIYRAKVEALTTALSSAETRVAAAERKRDFFPTLRLEA